MPQVFPNLEKIGVLSFSSPLITLAASRLTIGGQQYVTSPLTLTPSSLTANNLYMIYAVLISGVVTLVQSANLNSAGPSGYTAWKLVGAFYANGLASVAFGSFINIEGVPQTQNKIQYLGNIVDNNNTQVASGTTITNVYYWERKGRSGSYSGAYYHQGTAGIAGVGLYYIKIPTQYTVDLASTDVSFGGGNSGPGSGSCNGDIGGGQHCTGNRAGVIAGSQNGFGLRLQGDADAGNWGPTGSGGVLDAYSLGTTFLGMAWGDIEIPVVGWTSVQLKDL